MSYYISLLGIVIMGLSIRGMTLPENVDGLNAVTSSVNQFIHKFNKAVAKEETGNYICSPISAGIVLNMAAWGAEGNTKVELQQALGSSTDETLMKNGYQTLIDVLNNTQGVELAVANKLFTADGFQVKDSFKEITRTYFRSELESLDFSKIESAERINNWAAENTKDRIKEIIKPEDLQNAVMIMANAVYFKGKWAEKFDPKLTKPMPFHVDETTTKDVDMMNREGNYNWGSIADLNAKYIELPYENKNISMFIIVPDEINGLKGVEENLDKIDFAKLNRWKTEINLSIPKFKIESKFDLKSIFNKLNINDMFEDSANFHGITDQAPLKVSKVVQKAFIQVNEEGSEAAAVTDIEIDSYALPLSLRVDKPFICAIIVKTNKTLQLFNARVMDPTRT